VLEIIWQLWIVFGKGRVGNNLVLGETKLSNSWKVETKLSNSWKVETKLSNIMVGNWCHCFPLSFNYLSVKRVNVINYVYTLIFSIIDTSFYQLVIPERLMDLTRRISCT
jgi:hypothetical protein